MSEFLLLCNGIVAQFTKSIARSLHPLPVNEGVAFVHPLDWATIIWYGELDVNSSYVTFVLLGRDIDDAGGSHVVLLKIWYDPSTDLPEPGDPQMTTGTGGLVRVDLFASTSANWA